MQEWNEYCVPSLICLRILIELQQLLCSSSPSLSFPPTAAYAARASSLLGKVSVALQAQFICQFCALKTLTHFKSFVLLCLSACQAAESGNLDDFKRLYIADTTRIALKDGKGRTAAHQAAARNRVNILRYICDQHGGKSTG